MNSSDKIIGLDDTIDRLKKTTEDEKKRIGEREEIIKVLDAVRSEIHEIKKNMLFTDKMNEFFNKFDEFLNEFSHIEEYIKDPEAKGKLSKVVDDLRKFCTGFVKK